MTRRTVRDATIGVVYLVVIASLVALCILIYNKEFSTFVTVSLQTPTSGNALQTGSDVKARGVLVGTVSDVTSRGSAGADVQMNLYPSQADQLPTNITGELLPKTLFGEQYVSLTIPADPASGHLSSGDRIQPDTSPAAIEIQKLFDDLLPVLQAVAPQKLSATLGELAAALRGPVAGDLATLIDTVGPYVRKLAPHVTALSDDLAGLAKVARTYTQAAPDIVDALNSFTTTSRTLVAQRLDFENGLRALTSLNSSVSGLVGTSRDQIIGLARDSLPSLRTLARYSSEFPCLARALADYVPIGDAAFGGGTISPGAHVILHVIPTIAPYTPADAPSYHADSGPRCPYTPATTLSDTALSAVPGIQGASQPGSARSTQTLDESGLGIVNSPQENELIAELVAPSLGVRPATVPQWASLLLGPALRGAQVSLR